MSKRKSAKNAFKKKVQKKVKGNEAALKFREALDLAKDLEKDISKFIDGKDSFAILVALQVLTGRVSMQDPMGDMKLALALTVVKELGE